VSQTQQTPVVPQPMWQVVYNGTDITSDISGTITEITYEEEVGKKANCIEIKIDDSARKWQSRSYQRQGASIVLAIGYAGAALVPVGTFQFDEYSLDGPPDVFIIRAIQAPITQALRTRNTVAYENTTLVQVANTIAQRHGLTVVADAVAPNVTFQRLTQGHEEDLAFLHRVADEHGYEVQVRNDQLIFYARVSLETAAVSATTITRSMLTKFRLVNQTLGDRTYQAAVVDYFEPSTKALVSGSATDASVQTADTLKVIARAENAQQATLKAASHLHKHNKKKCTSELRMPGTMLYRAGMRVAIHGWGAFDLNDYLVQGAHHRLTRSGYETTLKLETNVVQQGAAGQVQDLVSDEEK
jgi:hypothetical protein